MISMDYVTAWRKHAPWVSDHQVEQDLVISRAIVEIFSSPEVSNRLSFRGGTALHKLFLRPATRYSEDIDLVQIAAEPIGDTFDRVRQVLDPWLGIPRRELKEGRVNLVYRFLSGGTTPKQLRLKVEINSREHFAELGHVKVPFEVDSRWWNGSALVTTYPIDEVLGTKLRALYQRKKGRDLFDLWFPLAQGRASAEQIVRCFNRYMREEGRTVSRSAFEENLTGKLKDSQFRSDMAALLRPGVGWDVDEAGSFLVEHLLAEIAQ